ncbi:hypothetical protein MTBLM1_10033 [Rhodospirillaceae bacterium LM-1]|nr:hypothetical protein MTBLM1_10033 [Rhodospirillaceae bacterium LM-1]
MGRRRMGGGGLPVYRLLYVGWGRVNDAWSDPFPQHPGALRRHLAMTLLAAFDLDLVQIRGIPTAIF